MRNPMDIGSRRNDEGYPLVTFALLTYNQEKFIEQALLGTLSQDYHNLEIIISDDHSSDTTYEIIERSVAAYTGQHTIKTNQNLTNLGLGKHVNQVMKMARGELVVLAAGDDISDSCRVSRLVKAWADADRPPALCSQAVVISHEGELISARYDGYDGRYSLKSETQHQSISRLLEADHCLLLGCTEAWIPRVFEVFGPLNDEVVHEDNAVSLRAWLLGRILYLEDRLVQYRTHDQNIAHRVRAVPRTINQFISWEIAYSARQKASIAHLYQHATDLLRAQSLELISKEDQVAYSRLLNRRLRVAIMQAKWWELPLHGKCLALFYQLRFGNFYAVIWGLPRLAGLSIFSLTRVCLAFASRARRNLANRLRSVEVAGGR